MQKWSLTSKDVNGKNLIILKHSSITALWSCTFLIKFSMIPNVIEGHKRLLLCLRPFDLLIDFYGQVLSSFKYHYITNAETRMNVINFYLFNTKD